MSNGCADCYQSLHIVNLLFELENYGPVHTRDTSCTESGHALIDLSMTEDSIRTLLIGAPLRPAALLEDDPLYPDYALPTFIHYVKTNEQFRHSPSNTWRAGPYGVRWIIAIYIHFAAAFSVYEAFSNRLPTDRICAFDGCNYQRLKGALVSFSSWLLDSLGQSIAILKRTFRQRAQAWREAVVAAYLAYPDENIGNESVLLDTHGIPRGKDVLTECYDELQASDLDITFGPDDQEVTRVSNNLRKRVLNAVDDFEMSDRDSTSGEEIEIPDFGSDTEDERSDSPRPDQSDAESDYDLGLHQSRIHSAPMISAMAFGGKATNKDSARSSPLLRPSEEPRYGTDDEDFREPSWMEASVVYDHTVDTDDSPLPQSVLADLSFLPQASTESNSIRRSKLTMEVVIPTPMKKSKPLKPSTKDQQGAEISPTGDSDEDPMTSKAVRRPRRSVARSGLVEAAIRAAAKGKYVPKGKEA